MNSNYVVVTSDKKKSVAMILCIFFGCFGFHHFYVGRLGMGLLYCFTCGLFLFGWIADIIKIASGTFRDGAGAPLRQ